MGKTGKVWFLNVLLSLTISLLLFETNVFSQTPVPGGSVSGTWTAEGSPYQILGDISLDKDSTLIIMPGVEVHFMQVFTFRIYGNLHAVGKPDSMIWFDTGNPFYRWEGIEFRDTTDAQGFSQLDYCSIRKSNHDYGGAIGIFGYDSLIISNSILDYNEGFKGGALYCEYSNPGLENLLIENNISVDGGGLFFVGSSPIIRNCSIVTNESGWIGGGIFCKENSHPVMDSCLIDGNESVGSGGGLYFHDNCQATVRNSTIINNVCHSTGVGSGGGMKVNFYCHVLFENCIIRDNISHSRGGGATITSDVDFVDCLITGNEASESGGGVNIDLSLLYYRPVVNIINSTLVDNQCDVGPELFSRRADIEIINSIVWETTTGNDPIIWVDKTNLLLSYSNIIDYNNSIVLNDSCSLTIGGGMLDTDPGFFSSTDFRLTQFSPCINAGDPDTTGLNLPPYDLDGLPRIYNGRIDMGCYENQYYVGIPDRELGLLSCYPNPTSGQLNIVVNDKAVQGAIRLVNMQGCCVMAKQMDFSGCIQLDLSDLPKGLYMLTLNDISYQTSIISERIVLQ